MFTCSRAPKNADFDLRSLYLMASTLSFQMRASRRYSITIGIEDRNLIAVIVVAAKYKLVFVIAMRAGRH
jgi:hypothetical protein